jgi:hypothetical protein
MATPAVNEAQAKAVQSARRRIEGKRERRAVPASRSQRARPARSVDWANFIEILICVVSTDLTIAALRCRKACELPHRFATPHAADGEIVRMRNKCVNTNENDSHQYYWCVILSFTDCY